MNVSEFPLVAFTICAQLSVGSFIVLGIVSLVAGRRYGRESLDKLLDPALYAIGPILVAGLIASVLHLGNPLRAMNSLRHVGTSPLSREILFGLLFAAFGALFALMQWRKIGTVVLRQAVALVTGAIGILLVWFMANVYMIPARPAWNSWYTPVSFYCTTVLLGSLAVGLALVVAVSRMSRKAAPSKEVDTLLRSCLRWIAVVSIGVLGVEFVTTPIYVLQMGSVASGVTGTILAGTGAPFVIRLILLFVGAGILGLYLYRVASAKSETNMLAVATTTAFVLVIVAEVLGRLMFYGMDSFGAAW